MKHPRHWAAVEKLAEELLKQNRIGYRKTRQIIKEVLYKNEQNIESFVRALVIEPCGFQGEPDMTELIQQEKEPIQGVKKKMK